MAVAIFTDIRPNARRQAHARVRMRWEFTRVHATNGRLLLCRGLLLNQVPGNGLIGINVAFVHNDAH